MKAVLALLLLSIFLTGCAAKPYAGSAKCMEQADIAYETNIHKNEPLNNECKATKVNTPNKEFENHSIVDRSLLQLIVSFLNGIFR
ncbi:hypothetical protein CWC16_02145 [Pseudoalteromonas sp. S3776]|uniref:hypothetical protein n=1 Tax=unclassified Pseudoalteromonas TaxID=194690 RepID=UPI0006D6722F|nr:MULTISPECIES: hypothetical protein [unclassified Pseudoalteromonas]MDC9522818.1 hypothetical protein [Pseudoalteromonas sp. Angola-31]KPZ57152.1 hypothetical protein AN393_00870 [Pseudoalteromonas sp. P1-25]KPZ59425.1 hypothetical protein AN391_01132 [Pseudoalteromonas sp. P1-13-1a]KPZ60333.1 hypothetical protein AN389_02431 [Pseudoalteromonas sp. P1-7a]TMO81951.1 hypothetical protein CWC16_02145 [Pseudoalteromonas sp. S3776]